MANFSISHPFGSGWMVSEARVYAGIARVDFRTEILNNDERVRYRVLFQGIAVLLVVILMALAKD